MLPCRSFGGLMGFGFRSGLHPFESSFRAAWLSEGRSARLGRRGCFNLVSINSLRRHAKDIRLASWCVAFALFLRRLRQLGLQGRKDELQPQPSVDALIFSMTHLPRLGDVGIAGTRSLTREQSADKPTQRCCHHAFIASITASLDPSLAPLVSISSHTRP